MVRLLRRIRWRGALGSDGGRTGLRDGLHQGTRHVGWGDRGLPTRMRNNYTRDDLGHHRNREPRGAPSPEGSCPHRPFQDAHLGRPPQGWRGKRTTERTETTQLARRTALVRCLDCAMMRWGDAREGLMAASRWRLRDACEQARAQRARLRGLRLHALLALRRRWVGMAPSQALAAALACIGSASRKHCARMTLPSQTDPTGVARAAGARWSRVLLVGRRRC